MVPPQPSHIDMHDRVVRRKKAREPKWLRDYIVAIYSSHFLFNHVVGYRKYYKLALIRHCVTLPFFFSGVLLPFFFSGALESLSSVLPYVSPPCFIDHSRRSAAFIRNFNNCILLFFTFSCFALPNCCLLFMLDVVTASWIPSYTGRFRHLYKSGIQ